MNGAVASSSTLPLSRIASKSKSRAVCCDSFHPASWDEKVATWNSRLFSQYSLRTIWPFPLRLSGLIRSHLHNNTAEVPNEMLVLVEYYSRSRITVYISVPSNHRSGNVAEISGSFVCKAFHSPRYRVGVWPEEMTRYVTTRKIKRRPLFACRVCPRCGRTLAPNHAVVFLPLSRMDFVCTSYKTR